MSRSPEISRPLPDPRTWQTPGDIPAGQWVTDPDGHLWQYVYSEGGFEGFRDREGRTRAPDLPGPFTEHDDPANFIPLARLCMPLPVTIAGALMTGIAGAVERHGMTAVFWEYGDAGTIYGHKHRHGDDDA